MATVDSIDITALYGPERPARDACDQELWVGLRRTGSVVITGYPDAKHIDARARTGLTFFDWPDSVKGQLLTRLKAPENPNLYRGYHPHDPESDFRTDMLDIGPEHPAPGPDLDGVEILTEPTPWPANPPTAGWAENVRAYYEQLDGLAKVLIFSIGRSAGFDAQTIEARFGGRHSTLRFLDYPATGISPSADDPVASAGRHTDASGLSLLWQAGPGLQGEAPDGEFYDIPLRENCISVHVGTVMETLTDGAVPATPHRVIDFGVRRQSVGFFLEPALSAPVTPASVRRYPVPVEDTYAWQVLTALSSYGTYGDEIRAPQKKIG